MNLPPPPCARAHVPRLCIAESADLLLVEGVDNRGDLLGKVARAVLPQSRLRHKLVADGTLNLGVDRQLLGIVVVALRLDKLGVEKVLVQLCV